MSLYGDYDSQNIFAKIIRGEMPCYKLYEDDDVLAFLDLFPQSFGHTLVIPKRAEARNLLEIDADSLSKLTLQCRRWPGCWPTSCSPMACRSPSSTARPPGRRCSTSICT